MHSCKDYFDDKRKSCYIVQEVDNLKMRTRFILKSFSKPL